MADLRTVGRSARIVGPQQVGHAGQHAAIRAAIAAVPDDNREPIRLAGIVEQQASRNQLRDKLLRRTCVVTGPAELLDEIITGHSARGGQFERVEQWSSPGGGAQRESTLRGIDSGDRLDVADPVAGAVGRGIGTEWPSTVGRDIGSEYVAQPGDVAGVQAGTAEDAITRRDGEPGGRSDAAQGRCREQSERRRSPGHPQEVPDERAIRAVPGARVTPDSRPERAGQARRCQQYGVPDLWTIHARRQPAARPNGDITTPGEHLVERQQRHPRDEPARRDQLRGRRGPLAWGGPGGRLRDRDRW